jgi:hypothetical protein
MERLSESVEGEKNEVICAWSREGMCRFDL